MKYILILFLTCNYIFAQDLIILTNGDEIESIVKEIGSEEIKYIKFNNQTGPMYSVLKSKVFMIRFENGTKEVFGNISSETEREDADVLESKYKELGVANGFFALRYFHDEKRINRQEFVNILSTNTEAYSYYTKYRNKKWVTRVFDSGFYLLTIITVAAYYNDETELTYVTAIGGLGLGVISRIISNRAFSDLELAILTFNNDLE